MQELDKRARRAEAELAGLEAGLLELRRYLTSPKFAANTRVEVTDVLLRMDEARSLGLDEAAVIA